MGCFFDNTHTFIHYFCSSLSDEREGRRCVISCRVVFRIVRFEVSDVQLSEMSEVRLEQSLQLPGGGVLGSGLQLFAMPICEQRVGSETKGICGYFLPLEDGNPAGRGVLVFPEAIALIPKKAEAS